MPLIFVFFQSIKFFLNFFFSFLFAANKSQSNEDDKTAAPVDVVDNCSASEKETDTNKTSALITTTCINVNVEKNKIDEISNENVSPHGNLITQPNDVDVNNMCGASEKSIRKSDNNIVKSNSDKSNRTMLNNKNRDASVNQIAKNACESNEKTTNVSLMKQNKCDININSDDVVASIDSDKQNADVVIHNDNNDDDDDDDPYAELEFYLEKVKVSVFKISINKILMQKLKAE